MSESYKIRESFPVNGKTVLALDRAIPSAEYRNKYVMINNDRIPYMFTHNDYWISVDGNHDYTGQTLTFVN